MGSTGPQAISLTTGLDEFGKAMFDDIQDGWRQALASGDVGKYRKFLKDMRLNDSDDPLESQ